MGVGKGVDPGSGLPPICSRFTLDRIGFSRPALIHSKILT